MVDGYGAPAWVMRRRYVAMLACPASGRRAGRRDPAPRAPLGTGRGPRGRCALWSFRAFDGWPDAFCCLPLVLGIGGLRAAGRPCPPGSRSPRPRLGGGRHRHGTGVPGGARDKLDDQRAAVAAVTGVLPPGADRSRSRRRSRSCSRTSATYSALPALRQRPRSTTSTPPGPAASTATAAGSSTPKHPTRDRVGRSGVRPGCGDRDSRGLRARRTGPRLGLVPAPGRGHGHQEGPADRARSPVLACGRMPPMTSPAGDRPGPARRSRTRSWSRSSTARGSSAPPSTGSRGLRGRRPRPTSSSWSTTAAATAAGRSSPRRRAPSAHVVALNLLKNYGQHHANLAGLREATGDYVITMDDDLQNPPDQALLLIDEAMTGKDVVFGRVRAQAGGRLPQARQQADQHDQPPGLRPADRPRGLQLPDPAPRRRRPDLRLAHRAPLHHRPGADVLQQPRRRDRPPRAARGRQEQLQPDADPAAGVRRSCSATRLFPLRLPRRRRVRRSPRSASCSAPSTSSAAFFVDTHGAGLDHDRGAARRSSTGSRSRCSRCSASTSCAP